MAGGPTPRRGIIAGINVTPLVDITLVLLVIFMVTAKFVVTPAIPLDLPTASHGQEVQVVFSVLLPTDGSVLVDGARVANLHALEERARAAAAEDDQLRAVIHADGAVPHRQVMTVLDRLRRAGIRRIAFATLPERQPATSRP